MRLHNIVKRQADSPTNAMIGRRKMEGELMRESEPVYVGMQAKQKLRALRAAKPGRYYGEW